jgi:sulfhydrogenase subunit delta
MAKPKIGIFEFSCCEGCQLQIVNMEDEILDLLSLVDPVEWREAMSDKSDHYDIAIVEGSITRDEDEPRLHKIRESADHVIAIGACATIGGINKLQNTFPLQDMRKMVYGGAADMPHLASARVKAIHEVVKVDYQVHGCPIDAHELAQVMRSLLAGKQPVMPDYPVCVECKLKENSCRYEYGEVCLGPMTRAGCDARCPSNGFWCFGCRGYVSEPNLQAAAAVMEKYGKTVDDLKSKLALFGSDQETKL